MADIRSIRPLRLGEEKKIEEERRKEGKKLQGKNIMAPLLHRAAIISNCSRRRREGAAASHIRPSLKPWLHVKIKLF